MDKELVVFYIDDFQRESYWENYILARPNYRNYGGCDAKTLYYPSFLQGRYDYIVNQALLNGSFEGYSYIMVINGKSNISNLQINTLLDHLKKTGADMIVPLSNRGRPVQSGAKREHFSNYAYLQLDCFLIKLVALHVVDGFEEKFCHITLPEMYLETYYTTLPGYDMSFCLKLWQSNHTIFLDECVKISFAERNERTYSPIQQSGGADAIWYYHQLLADDVEQCREGLKNIELLLANKANAKFPELKMDTDYPAEPDKKLILLVFPNYMRPFKAGIPQEECLKLFSVFDLFFRAMYQSGYTIQLVQRDLLKRAAAILFMWYPGDIFSVSNRVYELVYFEKWRDIIESAGMKKKTILCAANEPILAVPNHYNKSKHDFFAYVLTGNKQLIDQKKYFYQPSMTDFYLRFAKKYDFKAKKLCTFVCAGYFRELRDKRCLYPERLAMVDYFDQCHSDEFEFYGYQWPKEKYKTYKGVAEDRFEVFVKFKFVICIPNYIHRATEFFDPRIFDAMVVGSIPIYLGCPDIKDVVPEGTFVDLREFASYDDLYEFIRAMDEEIYNQYLKRIELFLSSPQAQCYSIKQHAEALIRVVEKINIE